ncbi:MAG: hypothetical protein LBR15_10740 [Methanobrevibacter sp.]|jgi:hypothetical protein|nr:hypothetical protein [Candidatus Methanovirga australis]
MANKLKLNKKMQETIAKNLEEGHTIKGATTLAGINKDTYYRWMKKGKEEKKGIYYNFHARINEAMEYRKFKLIQNIENHSEKSWQAAAWLLERVYPEEFSLKQEFKVDETHKFEGKLDINLTLNKIKEVLKNDNSK